MTIGHVLFLKTFRHIHRLWRQVSFLAAMLVMVFFRVAMTPISAVAGPEWGSWS
jgi:hypothetical protein